MKSFIVLFVCSFFVSASVAAEEMVYVAGQGEDVVPLSEDELERIKEERGRYEIEEHTESNNNKVMKVMSSSNKIKTTSAQEKKEISDGARGMRVR